MQVYRKILVTIDCSTADRAILRHVSALAMQNSAQVYLLHVVHAHTLDQSRLLYQQAEKYMESCRSELKSGGLDAFSLMRSGEPEEEILKEIDAGDYDLVAMGTHGHTFVGDILFGSVSEKLKHKIKIPLLLLKSDE
jgi:nucleotide-binding universal stress UspA family protein